MGDRGRARPTGTGEGPPGVIVVTRLAVRRRRDVEGPSEAWIRQRVELLRRIGWPAMQRAGAGVAWVLVVDPERLDLVRRLLGDLMLDDGSVHLAEGTGLAPTTSGLRLDTEVHPGLDSFVTFRLDNDDALLPGAVADVVDAARGATDGTLVDLPRGYQLELASGRLVEVAEPTWRQGPFLALVHRQRSTMFDTGGPHVDAREGRAVRSVTAPSWVQTIHDTNASNRLRAVTAAGRAWHAARSLPRGGARHAWLDGRPVAAADAARILASAGIVVAR